MFWKKARRIAALELALDASHLAADRRVEEATAEVQAIAYRQGRDAFHRAVAAEKRVRFLEEQATDRGRAVCLVKHQEAAA